MRPQYKVTGRKVLVEPRNEREMATGPGPFQTSGALGRGQRGITGLETAIELIAIVVVASVFAFGILSNGPLS